MRRPSERVTALTSSSILCHSYMSVRSKGSGDLVSHQKPGQSNAQHSVGAASEA